MGKKKSQRSARRGAPAGHEDATKTWTIMSQSAIVTIWKSRDNTFAVTFNENRTPVPPPDDFAGARSVMDAFAKLERADKFKEPDDMMGDSTPGA